MSKVISFTLAVEKKRWRRKCPHKKIIYHESGHYLTCSDCGAHLDAIQIMLEWLGQERRFRAHKASANRPDAVNELLAGKSPTQVRREDLRQYLESLEGCDMTTTYREGDTNV